MVRNADFRTFHRLCKDLSAGVGASCGENVSRKFSMTRKTTITIETSSRVVVRTVGSTRGWCPQCGAEVDFIAVGNVDAAPQGPSAAWMAWLEPGLESGALHRLVARDGGTLLCLESLLALMQTNPTRRAKERALQSPERK